MKIRAKILTGFLSVALLCGVVGMIGIFQLGGTRDSIASLSSEAIPKLNELGDIQWNLYALKGVMRSLSNPLGVDDDTFYKRQMDNITTFRGAYNKAIEDFGASSMTVEEAKLWNVFEGMIPAAKEYNDSIVALVDQARALKAQMGLQQQLGLASGAAPQAAARGAQAIPAAQGEGTAAAARAAIYDQIYLLISGDKRLIYDNMLAALQKLQDFGQRHYAEDVPKAATASAQGAISILLIIVAAAVAMAVAIGLLLGGSISNPVKSIAQRVGRIAAGDLSQKLASRSKDELGELAGSVNICIDNISSLVADADMLAKAAVEGRLATRADGSKHQGDYKKIVDGVNKTLDAVIGPLNVAANYVDRISKGDIPPKITDSYNGDFNVIKNNLNLAIDSINALVADAGTLVQAAVEGRLATRADASKHQGDYKKIVDGVNKTLDAVIGPLNVAANYVDRISNGNLPPKITDSYNGDFNVIKNNLNLAIDSINALVADAGMLVQAAVEGRLATRADASKHQGDYKKIVDGVNKTLDAVIGPLNVAADYVDKISKGNLPPKIVDSYNGDFNVIKNNLNLAIDSINALVEDAGMLVQAAVEGRLATRADASKHQGDYRRIVDGVNKTLDLVITPVNETVAVLKRLAEGDITLRMTGDYKGDFDILKTALNDSLESFNDILSQVNIAVDQVAEGSLQVSQASQSLSQGATEQASSLEEITSSVTEIASQTKLNTESAGTVNTLANTAKGNAEQGNAQMQNLVQAMGDINKSAEGIKTIVKAIDDISFQINLLALNANVEAARAGKYGKGFAVVAEEVRNLAVRSANSVKDTTRMVDEAIANIARGNELCDLTAKQLADIVGGAGQVATLAEEVATASKEQTQGLEQVSTGLNQIDQVTQANTASSEESASASEELSAQSQQVKSMLARFKLKAKEGKLDNAGMMQMLRAEMAKQGSGFRGAAFAAAGVPKAAPVGARKAKAPVNPAEVISLDDDNFGKF